MQFSKVITSIVASITFVSAAPTAVQDAEATAAAPKAFRLRSELIAGKPGFAGQWLQSYHTGAGLNAAVFTKNMTNGDVFHFNGTQLVTSLAPNYPVALGLGPPEDLAAAWGPTTLSITGASSNFLIDPNGYLWNNGNEQFNGWRICNWVHGEPELFHDEVEGDTANIPASCAKVHLAPVYV